MFCHGVTFQKHSPSTLCFPLIGFWTHSLIVIQLYKIYVYIFVIYIVRNYGHLLIKISPFNGL